MGLQLGIKQIIVDADFEFTAIGGYQCEGFNLSLKFIQQLRRQTDGPTGIVSNRAINQFDVDQHGKYFYSVLDLSGNKKIQLCKLVYHKDLPGFLP
jgi:hypothetical protein